jgi:L-amino acid N-acyltransferase YncA
MDWTEQLLRKLNAEEKRNEYDNRIASMTKQDFEEFSEWFHSLSEDEKFYVYFIERAMRLSE